MLLIYVLNFLISQIIPPNNIFLEAIATTANQTNLPTLPTVTATAEVKSSMGNHPDADDPAIYLHQEPSKSLIIGTYKKGGLRVYDITGKEIQSISSDNIRYNNIDIAYNVKYQSQIVGETASIDLAIASDRRNDTIAIWQIHPNSRNTTELTSPPLTNVTASNIPNSIFGLDDGEATAYGLATYTSIVDGKTYVFVSQSDGNKIAQLELQPGIGAADELTVGAKIVRILELPIPEGLRKEDAFVEGMVVDRDTGMLYLGQEQFGIWKLNAEPSKEPNLVVVDQVKDFKSDSPLTADIEGLAIYYGKNDQGYLIASSQGDNTFAVYNRTEDNSYLGSFAIAGVGATDGLEITDVPLGEQYPAGLLVVQNGEQKLPNFKLVSVAELLAIFQ